MNIQRIKIGSAIFAVICAVLCALTIIAALWLESDNPNIWKTIATVGILFFLSSIIHAIVVGIDRKTKE